MVCPFCGADCLDAADIYCMNCGNVALPINQCSECGKELPDEACYCTECGKPTLYFIHGLCKPSVPTSEQDS